MMFLKFALLAALAAPAMGFGVPRFGGGGKVSGKVSPEATEKALTTYNKAYGNAKTGSRYDLTEPELKKCFAELANVYGEDNASKMVNAVPGSLSFDPQYFKPTFDIFAETFGADKAKGMVVRNPNLLATKPDGWGGAGGAKEDTFYLSYVVAATRPIGKPALALGAFALATPFIEGVTGVPRDQFLSIIQGSL